MAYGLFLLNPVLFFPALLATIRRRYLVFASVFRTSVFWLLGACLIAAAFVAIVLALPPVFAAGLGGVIEILFAFGVFRQRA